ncbi:unnamed protein product [Prorocentrum cordatum]|uniref:Uncharacterized protein n=1 Tax=Prorocentrum cordatum TaxID=2364126 RepID=A0ABN9S6E3_9DINO|nr:unnamed protein product [Polarella glacialis]
MEKLQQEVKEAQEKLDRETVLLARQEEKPQQQNTRIDEISVPKAGQGWAATVAFLEQATKCLRDRNADPKRTDAPRHAQQQQQVEEDRAKVAADEAAEKKGFFTVNANAIGTLERALRSMRYTHTSPATTAQELQASPRTLPCFVQRTQKEGWRLGIATSVRAKAGGRSAGVLPATVRPNSMGYAKGLAAWDISPHESKGHLAIGWIDSLGKQGVSTGTAYIWASEGMTDRNKAILRNSTTAAMAAAR